MADETKPPHLPHRQRRSAGKPAAPVAPAAPAAPSCTRRTQATRSARRRKARGSGCRSRRQDDHGRGHCGEGQLARSGRQLAARHAAHLAGHGVGRVFGGVGCGAGCDRPLHVPERAQRAARSSSRWAFRPTSAWGSTSASRSPTASGSCAPHDDIVHRASGFYVLNTTCTHLGCTPNFLAAESKFKCPCHGSGFRPTGINFEGPAPRPLERNRIVLAEDGQILIDKSRKFQYELGQWIDPERFCKSEI